MGNVRECRSGTKQWKDNNGIFASGVRQTSMVVWTLPCLNVNCANLRNMPRRRNIRRRRQVLPLLVLPMNLLARAVVFGVARHVMELMVLESHRCEAMCLVVVCPTSRRGVSTASSNLPPRDTQVMQGLVTVVQLQRML